MQSVPCRLPRPLISFLILSVNGLSLWSTNMSCKSCHSLNQRNFGGEMGIHFIGLRNLDKPTVWVFPQLLVCMDCGFAECVVPQAEHKQLVTLSSDREMSLRRAV